MLYTIFLLHKDLTPTTAQNSPQGPMHGRPCLQRRGILLIALMQLLLTSVLILTIVMILAIMVLWIRGGSWWGGANECSLASRPAASVAKGMASKQWLYGNVTNMTYRGSNGTHMCVYIYIYAHVCMCICIYVYICTCLYVYIYIYMYTHICMYMYTYIYIYTYMHELSYESALDAESRGSVQRVFEAEAGEPTTRAEKKAKLLVCKLSCLST